MGLLTNEHSRNRLIKLLLAHDTKLCCLSYIAGVVWFLALAYQPFNAGTYISENALLPGLVESELPPMFTSAFQIKDEIHTEVHRDKKLTPQAWIYKKFTETGLETYTHNFSLIYPFRSVKSQLVTGENVYSILRGRRAASTEALVLSIPLRPLMNVNKERPATHGGIALALALAKEFKRKPYWSKDIIFLFTDFDEIGTLAWLDAYHQTESEYIKANDLPARSGPIQAAVNLELPAEDVSYYNLLLEGLNGQLPNLDLVNLVVRLCRREHSQVAIHHSMEKRRHQFSDSKGESWSDFKLSLSTMLRMMWYQASGAPSGNHGMFHKFHIEALTVQGVVKKKGSHDDIITSARIVEGVFRSLNNLLERFHQSFFFYLLPSTNRYVSIGMYMPAFEAEEVLDKVKEHLQEAAKDDEFEEDEADVNNPANQSVLSIVPIVLVSLLLAWMAHQGPELLMRIMPRFRIHTEDMVIYSMLAIFTAALMYPKMMIRKSSNPFLVIDWRLLKSVALIGQTLALACVALLNISQAFFLAAFMVPVTCSVKPSKSRILRWIQMLALVMVSLLVLMYFVGLASAWPQASTLDLLFKGYANTKHLIFLGLMDAYLFNAWSEMIGTAVIFPLWLLFWAVPWVDPSL
ncbi:glycosylphosphatidylinositol anchor attachment 1 protein [Elysia marginata]|uniref:Glycosylphosphatidylinositol anchor attachment 1 protein n=1 Tax=Elysia marginata TaxID=1093978 RepID=A0AAV4H082_9GAST|nr:glycosylphosphatidylinositol anchor attachment 1 protein [Elysia marginata]